MGEGKRGAIGAFAEPLTKDRDFGWVKNSRHLISVLTSRCSLFTAVINPWSDSAVGGGALASTVTSSFVLLPAGKSS